MAVGGFGELLGMYLPCVLRSFLLGIQSSVQSLLLVRSGKWVKNCIFYLRWGLPSVFCSSNCVFFWIIDYDNACLYFFGTLLFLWILISPVLWLSFLTSNLTGNLIVYLLNLATLAPTNFLGDCWPRRRTMFGPLLGNIMPWWAFSSQILYLLQHTHFPQSTMLPLPSARATRALQFLSGHGFSRVLRISPAAVCHISWGPS